MAAAGAVDWVHDVLAGVGLAGMHAGSVATKALKLAKLFKMQRGEKEYARIARSHWLMAEHYRGFTEGVLEGVTVQQAAALRGTLSADDQVAFPLPRQEIQQGQKVVKADDKFRVGTWLHRLSDVERNAIFARCALAKGAVGAITCFKDMVSLYLHTTRLFTCESR